MLSRRRVLHRMKPLAFTLSLRLWQIVLVHVFSFAAVASTASAALSITQDEISSSFGKDVEILIDAPDSMTVEEALESALLTPYTHSLVNLGNQTSAAWLRFEVRNDSGSDGTWVLNSLRSNVEVLEIYKVTDRGIDLLFDNADDAQRRKSLKRFFNLVAQFTMQQGERATFVVRFKAAVAGWLPMRLIPSSMLTRFTFSQFTLFIFSTAGTGVLIFSNLALFLATRERIYILYTAATSALLLTSLHLQGMTTAWWFYASPEWGRVFGASSVTVAALLLLTFARQFLEQSGKVFADYWYRVVSLGLGFHLLALPGATILQLQGTGLLLISAWSVVVITFVSLPIQVLISSSGRTLERAMLGIAWTVLSVQFVVLMLSTAGVLPGGYMDWYLLGPACFVEAALVAVALALRVRRLQHQKEEVDAQYKATLQEMSERAGMVLAASHDARDLLGGALALNRRVAQARDLDNARLESLRVDDLLCGLSHTMNLMVSNNRQVGSTTVPMIESLDMGELFQTLSLTFREVAEKHGKEISWRSHCDSLACDRSMLLRVVSNLLLNAIKYSRGKRILLTCRYLGDEVCIRVYDQGPGLSAENLARVMSEQRSVRISPQQEGTGVGLATCRELAAAFGGFMEARSNPLGGSMFGIRIPLPDLSTSDLQIEFLQDSDIWGRYAQLLNRGHLVEQAHSVTSKSHVYVYTENVAPPACEGLQIVACFDRSQENRTRWANSADAILCFPVSLPALAYAISVAVVRRNTAELRL